MDNADVREDAPLEILLQDQKLQASLAKLEKLKIPVDMSLVSGEDRRRHMQLMMLLEEKPNPGPDYARRCWEYMQGVRERIKQLDAERALLDYIGNESFASLAIVASDHEEAMEKANEAGKGSM